MNNPYRFLAPFGPGDAEIFRGRDREIRAVLNNALAARVTVLYAPSGAGKTSLINAGLVPELKDQGFVPITVRPRPAARPDNPLEAIRDQIAAASGSDTTKAGDLAGLIRTAAERGGGPVLLICDQFEELFIHFSDTPEQENLKRDCLRALGHLWSDRDLPVYLVFSLREDHVGNLIELKEYIPVIYANSVRLRPLTVESAREAIVEPAARYRTFYESGCVDLILEELAQGQWVEAARLQIVCHRLWEACRPRQGDYTFTKDDYQEKLGGAKRIVEQYLDDALRELTRDEHDLAIEILGHLTRDKRRTARSAAELASISSNPKASSQRVIATLEEQGLIRTQRWREELWYELTSEFAIEAISHAMEALDQAREKKRGQARTRRYIGTGIGSAVILVGLVFGVMTMRERQRSRDLFESRLTYAARQAANEDFVGALQTIRLGRELAGVVSPTRRQSLELLARYADLLGGSPGRTFPTHKGDVLALAISPDGRFVASGGKDRIIRIRDLHTENLIREWEGHGKTVRSLCFRPKGQWLASGSDDGTIKIWRVSDWTRLRSLSSDGRIWSVACSPDGRWLASGGTAFKVTLWDTKTWRAQWTRDHEASVEGLAFSPDSRLLASASYDHTVRIWNVGSGKRLNVLEGHPDLVHSVAFSPDGERVASSGGGDRSIRIWNLESGKTEETLTGHRNMVFGLVYLDEGRYLASASRDRTIRVWDLKTGKTVRVLQGHEAAVTRLAVSRDGEYLVSVGNDGTVRVWRWRPQPWVHTWDTGQGELYSAAIDPDEKWLVTGDKKGNLVVWSLPSRKELHPLKEAHADGISRLAFSPDGRLLASASHDKNIKLWDTATWRKRRTLEGHGNSVYSVAFSPDGRYLASAGFDGQIGLWEVETREKSLVQAHESEAYTVAFSPDGQLLASGGEDAQVILWQVRSATLERVHTLPGHTAEVYWIAFSPGGQRLVSVSRDQVVRFWDVTTGERVESLVGHENTVFRAAFSPDGGQVASVSADRTLRFWDADRGQPLLTLSLPAMMWDFAWSRSGRWLAIPDQDGTVNLHDLGDIYSGG